MEYANRAMVMKKNIDELHSLLSTCSFAGREEEITFFKEVMPDVFRELFLSKNYFSFETLCTFKTESQCKEHCVSLLLSMEQFAIEHLEFYLYHHSKSGDQDELYFSIGESRQSLGFDRVLGQLYANERFSIFLKDQLRLTQTSALEWTGSKTDVMELVMALHAAKVVNHGKVELKLLATSIENLFGIKLHDCYDVAKKIRMRKINRTSFLTTLIEKLVVRMDDFEK